MDFALWFPVHLFVAWVLGLLHREQREVMQYLREENRVLRAQFGNQRMRLTDADRRRLAVLGARLGRRLLAEMATIVTPDTILRWRELTDATDGVLKERRFLICDRDRKWSTGVRDPLEMSDVHGIRTPFRAPNCNAHAERFVRSIKEGVWTGSFRLGSGTSARCWRMFVVHYHRERNHQGLATN